MLKQRFLVLFFITALGSIYANENPSYKLFIFEGSDWCTNCFRLKKYILSDSVFKAHLKSKSISSEMIDFPQRKKQKKEEVEYNKAIAEKYTFPGVFPYLILTKENCSDFYKIDHSSYTTNTIILELEKTILKLAKCKNSPLKLD